MSGEFTLYVKFWPWMFVHLAASSTRVSIQLTFSDIPDSSIIVYYHVEFFTLEFFAVSCQQGMLCDDMTVR